MERVRFVSASTAIRLDIVRILCFTLIVALSALSGYAGEKPERSGEIWKGVRAEGACAIVGMSAEQCQLTALQRARAAAIEQAAGVSVSSGTLVTNSVLAADFIKTYAKGYIISEKVAWLPLGQYQKDISTAPISEYRVGIIADVHVPERKTKPLGMKARLNNAVFRAGEKAKVGVRTEREARIAIFCIMADDRVALLFPDRREPENQLAAGKELVFPAGDARVDLEMQPLPGHRKDAEAIFVVACDKGRDIDFMAMFTPSEPLAVGEFFKRLADISGNCEDMILPYEVVAAPALK